MAGKTQMTLFTILNQYAKHTFQIFALGNFNLAFSFFPSSFRLKVLFQNNSSLLRKNVAIKMSARISIFAHRSEILSQSEYLTTISRIANYLFLNKVCD